MVTHSTKCKKLLLTNAIFLRWGIPNNSKYSTSAKQLHRSIHLVTLKFNLTSSRPRIVSTAAWENLFFLCRVLEWSEGYYNGHIKTRRAVQTTDVNTEKLGSERSEQLRKLYEALLEGEFEQGTKKLSVTLSLEDLSDLEWYYLVSMSFKFKVGQRYQLYSTYKIVYLLLCSQL